MRCYKSLVLLIALTTIFAACSTAPRKTVADDAALQIAQQYNCLACHGIDKRIIGPSFNQIAAKYRGQDVQQHFFVRLRKGGVGVWGTIAEPPHIAISDNDLKSIIRWITELDGTPIKSQLEKFNEEISSYLSEQGKNPAHIIKYSDSNGSVARAVLNPDRASLMMDELKMDATYVQNLKAILEQRKPISLGYSNAFKQFPGQYDAEYLDDLEFGFQIVNAISKTIRDSNTATLRKDESLQVKVQSVAKTMQSTSTFILKMLEQQIREKKFSEEFTPIAIARLNRLQASQILTIYPDTKSIAPGSTN